MIAKLRGTIDTIFDDSCIIDVNGVGYLFFASSKTLSRLIVGQEASLLIETVVREDSITLFGFADAWEKEWFNALTKVQGVGAKVCLSILSVLTPAQLSQAISAQDKNSFLRASGVGPKLAARLVTELKDKIVIIPSSGATLETAITGETAPLPTAKTDDNHSLIEDIISALSNLGYQRLEAYQIASKVVADNHDKSLSDLIRLSLKEFAKKDF